MILRNHTDSDVRLFRQFKSWSGSNSRDYAWCSLFAKRAVRVVWSANFGGDSVAKPWRKRRSSNWNYLV